MNKYNIAVLTGTRADYHLLYPLLKKIDQDSELNLLLIVTGAHLSPLYGNTYQYIDKDGFENYYKIPILNDNENIDYSIAKVIMGTSDFFSNHSIDLLVVLGDRYEALGTVIAAGHHHIPIAHIHGGETTEGAIDESIRHSITKFSHLHFTSCEEYRERVIQLGEDPNSVFNVGALGVENILTEQLLSREELVRDINFAKGSYALVTFHPVTLEKDTAKNQVTEMLEAFLLFDNLKFIITKSNADAGGKTINEIIDQYCSKYPNQFYSEFSLGMIRYLSAMKYAALVIGNSSSGIIESPSFEVPTINIGDRQKGRKQAINIINCEPIKKEIYKAMKLGLSQDFRKNLIGMTSPYGNGKTSQQILDIIKFSLKNKKINLKKKFYNIKFKQ